jgi:putative flippase GtrA
MRSYWTSSVAGIILSLSFSYVPGLKDWFSAKDPVTKRLIMGGLVVLAGVGAFALSCFGWLNLNIPCDADGGMLVLKNIIAALITNQTAYMLSPSPAQIRKVLGKEETSV